MRRIGETKAQAKWRIDRMGPWPRVLHGELDPHAASVTSLLRFADNSLFDDKGVVWTPYNSPTISGNTLTLNGTNQYLQANSNLDIDGAGCVEMICTISQSADGNYHAPLSSNSGSGTRWAFSMLPTSGDLAISTGGAWVTIYSPKPSGQVHLALATDGSGVRLAVDGVWGATTHTGSLNSTASGFIIGRMDTGVNDYYTAMSVKAFRVTNGTSRYTLGSNFTPPTIFPPV